MSFRDRGLEDEMVRQTNKFLAVAQEPFHIEHQGCNRVNVDMSVDVNPVRTEATRKR